MIDLSQLKSFYTPSTLQNNISFEKNILKEYLELLVLEYLSTTPHAAKLSFIGGTNLRLVRGINRFSEDLDFDIHDFSETEFIKMTDGVAAFLESNGFPVEIRDKYNSKLTAFRRNLYFPGLLYSLGLTGHKEERFLLKIEAQDQKVEYKPEFVDIRRNGFFFPIQTPPLNVLLSMKLSALLNRAKGRDFYDTLFLLSNGALPDYNFLKEKCGIDNSESLAEALEKVVANTDLDVKRRDFTHLIFNPSDASKIMLFPRIIETLKNRDA
ncbi:MAG: nucleotidyl transferase AbiEii/AbiGii toxin family protein [Muribaculaceae bacterium]|nr:nucleotidyl transferase AbiEii/AbiGii toxin family protein [Muribaculaceae bacterium]